MTPASNLPPPNATSITGPIQHPTDELRYVQHLSPNSIDYLLISVASSFKLKKKCFNYRKVTIEKNLDHFDITPYAYYNYI